MDFAECLLKRTSQYGLRISEEQCQKFVHYYDLLREWNEKINLTAIIEPDEVAVKHIVDSISAWDEELFANDMKVIDVGTGAGFPGIVLKIIYPEIKLTLLDSLAKRINFLQIVGKELGLEDVEYIHGRAEEVGRMKKHRCKFDIAFSRAVARLPILCEYVLPLLKTDGYFAALKGRQYKEEMEQSKSALNKLVSIVEKVKPVKLPDLDDVRAVIYIRKNGKTPSVYPRKVGTPERKPL